MPRGRFRTQPGWMNSQEAKELASEIRAQRPDLDVQPTYMAQGAWTVELRQLARPYDRVATFRTRQAYEAWKETSR